VRKVVNAQHWARLPSKRKIKKKTHDKTLSQVKYVFMTDDDKHHEKRKNVSFKQMTTHITSYMFEYIYETAKDGIRILSGPFKLEIKTIPEKESCTYAG
jgi:hypothetical protein